MTDGESAAHPANSVIASAARSEAIQTIHGKVLSNLALALQAADDAKRKRRPGKGRPGVASIRL
jgi:hypothetical protein